ncbi:DUF4169 family protein [Pseudoruegeria sp. SK021]|uniref:DUF4169 family protein n=1 Tax=Pseudoruegeria sp. SK021 TaxID=1933035 RepID=UPI000A248AFC|nr:DUF4169 family protein [Pseudoruegeria sp. SK021]OSP55565.1 DUF4169 domain-containing protein [Pseudoruegeria sp. SK021]
MAEGPINLNRARKARARAAAKVQADSNAVKFGRSKVERNIDADKAARDAQHLDGHHRDRPE